MQDDKKRSGQDTADNYNPVNMAGKTAGKVEKPLSDEITDSDEYNPVNMAGKRTDTRKDESRPQRSAQCTSSRTADPTPARLNDKKLSGKPPASR